MSETQRNSHSCAQCLGEVRSSSSYLSPSGERLCAPCSFAVFGRTASWRGRSSDLDSGSGVVRRTLLLEWGTAASG